MTENKFMVVEDFLYILKNMVIQIIETMKNKLIHHPFSSIGSFLDSIIVKNLLFNKEKEIFFQTILKDSL